MRVKRASYLPCPISNPVAYDNGRKCCDGEIVTYDYGAAYCSGDAIWAEYDYDYYDDFYDDDGASKN